MARGWGKNEEDLGAEKEEAAQEKKSVARFSSPEEAQKAARRHTLELSLARIREELSRTTHETRRKALQQAKEDLELQLGKL